MKWFKRKERRELGGAGFIVTGLLVVLCLMAWEQIVKVRIPFVRAARWCWGECLVCGRTVGRYRYCSLECSAYDGSLRDPKKSWVLFGTLKEPKRHYEADMREE